MLVLLGELVTGVAAMATFVLVGIVDAINLTVVAIGAAIVAVLALLPSMPTVPDPPPVLQYVNWLFPVGDVLAIFGTFLTLYVAYLVIRTLLHWLRVA